MSSNPGSRNASLSRTRPLPDPPTSAQLGSHASPMVTELDAASSSSSTHSTALDKLASTRLTALENGDTEATTAPILCDTCKQGLQDTPENTVVSFGKFLYHVDCRCAKCHNLVEHHTNLLLLSDGNPVCENCSYICSVCQKSIQNEAIITGDESYHADCFRCRSCSNKIEELVFAKTTVGIWCMTCHNERVARSRKNSEAKRSKSVRTKDRDPSSRSSRSRGERERVRDRERNQDLGLGTSGRDVDRADRRRQASSSANGDDHDGSTTEYSDIPPLAPSGSSAALGVDQSRPLPPSPYGHGPSASASTMSLADLATTTTLPSSKLQLRPQRAPPVDSYSVANNRSPTIGSASSPEPGRSSSQLGSTSFSSTASGTQQPRVPSPSSSSNVIAGGVPPSGRSRTPVPSSLATMPEEDSGPSTSIARGADGVDLQQQQQQQQPRLRSPTHGSFSGPSAPQSRSGSLSAPATAEQKSANRRSGFYGSMSARGSIDEAALNLTTSTQFAGPTTTTGTVDQNSLAGFSTSAAQDHLPASSALVHNGDRDPDPVHDEQDNFPDDAGEPDSTSFLPELHQSMSFYDPDTLLFLNNVGKGSVGGDAGSNPSSPQGKSFKMAAKSFNGSSTYSRGRNDDTDEFPADAPTTAFGDHDDATELDEHLERLSVSDDDAADLSMLSSGDGRAPRRTPGRRDSVDEDGLVSESGHSQQRRHQRRQRGSDVSQQVRESIRSSRQGGTGGAGAGGLDVELVEMLLGELDGTKKEMQELQSKYSAFRRVSRTAFEGFSMAREEYDKEVAARRETEAQMASLRSRFLEQAQRLAAVDQEQRSAEALKRQSTDLRSSVVGMEKHLSILRAEVELSTAQVAELTALDVAKADLRSHGDRSSVASADLAAALSTRLETVKNAHRNEIKDLVAQRDELARQVDQLKEALDSHTAEATLLQANNASLVKQNAEATQLLEVTREAIAKSRMLGTPLMSSSSSTASFAGHGSRGPGTGLHQHSMSSVSLMSSLSPSLSHRTQMSSTLGAGEVDQLYRVAKPETTVEPSSGKKFKWGKGSKSTSNAGSSSSGGGAGVGGNGSLTNDAAGRAAAGGAGASAGHASSPMGKITSPVVPRAGSVDSSIRAHVFQQTSILRPVRCDYCGDKMWGLNEVRCGACGCYAHTKCAGYLSTACSSSPLLPSGHAVAAQDDTMSIISSAPAMFGNNLTAQVRAEGRDVPLVVSKCISAVEAHGMNYEGIYRKTGGMGQTKLITQNFERGEDFDLEDLDKFNDVAAVTSCLKNFFRCLPIPLFTHDLHEQFVSCAEMPEGEERLLALEQILRRLPEAHYCTARALLHHLNRVHQASGENKMTPANLGVVFGPTVLRSSVASREFSDMGPKAKIVEILVEHAERLFKDSTRSGELA